MLSRWSKLVLVFFSLMVMGNCASKVYPDERLVIASDFLALFNSVVEKDTFSFRNKTGSRKSFAITKIDSIISNKKGWFINERPYKLLRMNFRETGKDTVKLKRDNEVFVNKDPGKNLTSIAIQFNNFFFDDTILPQLHHDTLSFSGKKLTNYYLFETALSLTNPNDIRVLYMSGLKGFLAFKTMSGEVWLNETE
jgi:hypothetical protein